MPDVSSRVPVSSQVLLGSVMLLFFSLRTEITLQAKWEWWVIPLAAAAVIAVVLSQRLSKHRRASADLGGARR